MTTAILKHPEWKAWLLSASAWIMMLAGSNVNGHTIIACAPEGIVIHNTTILAGFSPWIIMVLGMMVPLLNDPIRHISFSVRKKQRLIAFVFFLVGYLLVWIPIGIGFNLLLQFLKSTGVITLLIFVLAGIIKWLSIGPVLMIKCSQRMPISIQPLSLIADTISYGVKMGLNCLCICGLPMLALLSANHNMVLMILVTAVLIFERYALPHRSTATGYLWPLVGIAACV